MGTMDSEAIETAEWQYGKIKVAEGAEKPSMADWFTGMRENPESIPKAMSSFMVASQDAQTQERIVPKQVKIGTSPPAAAGGVTVEAIRSAKEKARRTGDWSEFKKLSKQLG